MKDMPDQFKLLGNCPHTTPLSQHFALSEKLSDTVGLGEG